MSELFVRESATSCRRREGHRRPARAITASARTSWRRRDGFEDRPLLFTNEEGIDWVLEDADAGRAARMDQRASLEGADGRPPDRRRRRLRSDDRAKPAHLGHGPPQPREQRRHSRATARRSCCPATTRSTRSRRSRSCTPTRASDADGVWNDEGNLWAFVADDPDINDYYDFRRRTLSDGGTCRSAGTSSWSRSRSRPARIRTAPTCWPRTSRPHLGGPYPPPPADGTWQRGPGITSGPGIDGPQWILEHWGDREQRLPVPADRGHRLRQATRDVERRLPRRLRPRLRGRRPARASRPTAASGRWSSTRHDPTIVDSLSILIEGDDNPVKTLGEIHQPDNIESTVNGLLITEDPGSAQQFALADQGLPNATTARLMYYRFSDGADHGRPQGRPVGRRGPHRRGPATTAGNVGRVGDERDHRRLVGVRPGQVPDRRPGAHPVRRHRHDVRARQPRARRVPTGPGSARAASSSW